MSASHPSLGKWIAVSLAGAGVTLTGFVWDALSHARDPGLVEHEGTFLTASAPHILIAAGLLAMGAGIVGAARAVLARSRPRLALALVAGTALAVAGAGGAMAAMSSSSHEVVHEAAAAPADAADDAHKGHTKGDMPKGDMPKGDMAKHNPGRHDLGVTDGEATPEQEAAAQKLVQDTRAATARLKDLSVALGEGYRRNPTADPDSPMAHYANATYHRDGAVLDVSKPESLVYWDPDRTKDGDEVLLGVVFKTGPGIDGPQVGGPLTVWHTHADACETDPQSAACTRAPEMMHLWLAEGAVNPFAPNFGVAMGKSRAEVLGQMAARRG